MSGSDLLDAESLPALAARAARERPRTVGFLVPSREGFQPVACEPWWAMVQRLAAVLIRRGLEPGDRVLLISETRFEWLLCDLAILSCGAVTVPVYPNLPASQIAHPLEDARPRLAIASRPELARRLERAQTASRPEGILLIDGEPEAGGEIPVSSLGAVVSQGSLPAAEGRIVAERIARIDPAQVATILYTSGTSSRPKGVVLSHASILSNARMILSRLPIGPNDRYLSILPLTHLMERTTQYTMLSRGTTIAYARSLESLGRDAASVRPTVLLGVPRLYEQIVRSIREAAIARGPLAARLYRGAEEWAVREGQRRAARPRGQAVRRGIGSPGSGIGWIYDRLFFSPLRQRLGGQIRFLVSGSAPLGGREARFFWGAGLPLLEGYGLTEAGPVVSVNTPSEMRLGTVGRPLAGVELRIDEDSEILVRSASLMSGYLHLEAETREALEGGWLRTGDLGALDPEGFLSITGRKKDIIVTSGGKNISPGGIEEALRLSPYIQEAAVFGDRRPYLVALLLPDAEALERDHGPEIRSPERLPELRAILWKQMQHLLRDSAPHERVRSFDFLPDAPSIEEGTLTPTMKLKRGALEAKHADRIAALYDRRS